MLKPDRLFKKGHYNKYSLYQYYYVLAAEFFLGVYYLPLIYLILTGTHFPREYYSLNLFIMLGLIVINLFILYERKTNKEFFSSKSLFHMKPLAIIFLILFLLATSIIGMFAIIETSASNFQYMESVNIDVSSTKTYFAAGMPFGEYREIDIEVVVINELHSDDMDENEFEVEVIFSGGGYNERRSFYSEGKSTTFHVNGDMFDESSIGGATINLYKKDGYMSSMLQSMYIPADIGPRQGGNISGAGGKPNLSSGYLIMILVIIIIELVVLSAPQFFEGTSKKK
jgi:hypothetical protein